MTIFRFKKFYLAPILMMTRSKMPKIQRRLRKVKNCIRKRQIKGKKSDKSVSPTDYKKVKGKSSTRSASKKLGKEGKVEAPSTQEKNV